jgi:hypothetical protein
VFHFGSSSINGEGEGSGEHVHEATINCLDGSRTAVTYLGSDTVQLLSDKFALESGMVDFDLLLESQEEPLLPSKSLAFYDLPSCFTASRKIVSVIMALEFGVTAIMAEG